MIANLWPKSKGTTTQIHFEFEINFSPKMYENIFQPIITFPINDHNIITRKQSMNWILPLLFPFQGQNFLMV